MAKYIECEAVVGLLEECKRGFYEVLDPYGACACEIIKNAITELPAADVRPVVRGKWVWKHRYRGGFQRVTGTDDDGNIITITVDQRFEVDDPYCSECGKLNDSSSLNFCPNCGADMRGEAKP